MRTLLRIITGLTGAVIAIESLALFVGLRILSPEQTPWAGPKNDAFVLLDVIVGGGLIYLEMTSREGPFPPVFFVLVAVSLLAHGYREWEYLAGVDDRFTFNLPLFLFNNIRLVGLLASIVCICIPAMLQSHR